MKYAPEEIKVNERRVSSPESLKLDQNILNMSSSYDIACKEDKTPEERQRIRNAISKLNRFSKETKHFDKSNSSIRSRVAFGKK